MNEHVAKIKKMATWLQQRRDLSIFCGLAILALLSQLISSHKPKEVSTVAAEETFDTYIPEGFSLVPIEVANVESLDALLGDFGVVDLYSVATPSSPQPQRVAYKIKIMRAPKNPQHFAVLVPFSDVSRMMKFQGPFTVSVQNPKTHGSGFEKEKKKAPSRVGFNM